MANRVYFAALGVVAMVGCAVQPRTVATLPPPSLSAPAVAPPPAPVAVVPVAPAPVKTTTLPKSTPRGTASLGAPRDWVPTSPARQWYWIVIHHSATAAGGAAAFDKMHKAKGWDGLGYDFVIGNGTDTRDGQVEVGYRWRQQLTGAHDNVDDNRYNEHGIGICLVGNFDIDRPTPAQMQSLAKLMAYLMKTYKIAPANVKGHGDTKKTDCPGKNLSIATATSMAQRLLTTAGEKPAKQTPLASGEMLQSDR